MLRNTITFKTKKLFCYCCMRIVLGHIDENDLSD